MTEDGPEERPVLEHVTDWPGGFSWIASPAEDAERASHALSTSAGVWLVDPVDAAGLDDRVADLGSVAGVIVLQDRHTRDAAALARRHEVAVSVPEWMSLTPTKLESAPESVGAELPGTGYAIHQLIVTEDWEEAILVDDGADTMVVPEALGTLPAFGDEDEVLGVHPALDDPPERLAEWTPERILVGHGESVHEAAARRLSQAIGGG